MNIQIEKYADMALNSLLIDREQCVDLYSQIRSDFWDAVYWANLIREKYFAKKIKVCSIVPGRVGGCSEDCKFCAQSASYNTHVGKAEYTPDEDILKAAQLAKENGVPTLGIVNSGQSVTDKELDRICGLVKRIHDEYGIKVCAGLGVLNQSQADRLAVAGVARYNHNLETSQRNFPNIVTTHNYSDRVSTIEAVKKTGMGICAGGIFGLGETDEDRIDMALDLRKLAVDMVPMNFLHAIEGTPLAKNKPLTAREVLELVVLYRFIIPKAEIKVAGGRLVNLRDTQSWMFAAGATAIMSGDYLTTAGRSVEQDMQMVRDLGLEPELVEGCS